MNVGGAGSLLPPVLSPSSLYTQEAKRDATRIRTYNMILSMIYNKIKAASRIAGGDKAIFYLIPELIPGTPRFDMGDAVLYIVWNLRNAGYAVEYTYPNALFVSWRAHEARYRTVDSPWSKVLESARTAVLHTPPPTLVSDAKSAPAPPPEITKRKSVLKKTVEFNPGPSLAPASTNPGIVAAMYSSAAPALPTSRLPGQLSEKHISFV